MFGRALKCSFLWRIILIKASQWSKKIISFLHLLCYYRFNSFQNCFVDRFSCVWWFIGCVGWNPLLTFRIIHHIFCFHNFIVFERFSVRRVWLIRLFALAFCCLFRTTHVARKKHMIFVLDFEYKTINGLCSVTKKDKHTQKSRDYCALRGHSYEWNSKAIKLFVRLFCFNGKKRLIRITSRINRYSQYLYGNLDVMRLRVPLFSVLYFQFVGQIDVLFVFSMEICWVNRIGSHMKSMFKHHIRMKITVYCVDESMHWYRTIHISEFHPCGSRGWARKFFFMFIFWAIYMILM